ncbi:RNA-DIRECTED DNA METHYLATION 1 [Perilla frutescens var. hirtella]|uniref:RNA-DIRECTED DNA METHYLATION 1 n=1 Tax=Perilla frutescens var. hirtella TaxID=608512 RepID=A0AAD4IUI0_PERFH|nr:RNA-DIRECTED DNA METHYLATION 1 [Perilla frutescens var. frutescens]KAH6821602.1 RNA-DIRECTED DNA METHYLATION 1 [Perilla frutescens var. hirtella]
MKRPASSEQVEISSDDSSSDAENSFTRVQQPYDDPTLPLSPAAWLFRRAKSYQDYMKLIPIPGPNRGTVIPYTSWTGLGTSLKQIYDQPLHYLTNIQLKRMDRERLGAEDEDVLLETIIHPSKAEATIWLIEEVHRRTASPYHIAELWEADPMYHAFIDTIFPKLGS